jgi:hypothetical protein
MIFTNLTKNCMAWIKRKQPIQTYRYMDYLEVVNTDDRIMAMDKDNNFIDIIIDNGQTLFVNELLNGDENIINLSKMIVKLLNKNNLNFEYYKSNKQLLSYTQNVTLERISNL